MGHFLIPEYNNNKGVVYIYIYIMYTFITLNLIIFLQSNHIHYLSEKINL